MKILVLGLGNILLSDEGVGVRIVETLSASHELPEEVELLDGGTSGMDLLDTVADRDLLIVADAVNGDGPAGRGTTCRRWHDQRGGSRRATGGRGHRAADALLARLSTVSAA